MRWVPKALFAVLLLALTVEFFISFPIVLGPPPPRKIKKQSGEYEEPPERKLGENIRADQKMEGVHLIESANDRRDWELFADAAASHEAQGYWDLKNVKVQFYRGDNIEMTVLGSEGIVETKTKDLKISGDVQMKSLNGYEILTPGVQYVAKGRKIVSLGKVFMQGPPDANRRMMKVRAQKFTSFIDESRILVEDRVEIEKPFQEKKWVKIQSDKAQFSSSTNQAKFFGRVKMNVDDIFMTGPEALFSYDGKSENLKNVQILGGVNVDSPDKKATSEKIEFNPLSMEYLLTGKPKVQQGEDTLQGEQIRFLEGGKKVKIDKIKAKVKNNEFINR